MYQHRLHVNLCAQLCFWPCSTHDISAHPLLVTGDVVGWHSLVVSA